MKAFIKTLSTHFSTTSPNSTDNIELSGEFRMWFDENPYKHGAHRIRAQIKDLVWKTLTEVEIELPKDEVAELQEKVFRLEMRIQELEGPPKPIVDVQSNLSPRVRYSDMPEIRWEHSGEQKAYLVYLNGNRVCAAETERERDLFIASLSLDLDKKH